MPPISLFLKLASLAVAHAGTIRDLLKAGVPLETAIEDHAPELRDVMKEVVAQMPPDPAGDHVSIAKAIYTPDAVSPAEQDWMDHASRTTGL